jgi:hypothetical protein
VAFGALQRRDVKFVKLQQVLKHYHIRTNRKYEFCASSQYKNDRRFYTATVLEALFFFGATEDFSGATYVD